MEHENFMRQKWQRAPSSVALACAECKCLITPCIICAHPIPFVNNSIWLKCGYCGAVNPLRELERHMLGLPPPLALALSMVRRVMVAHVGRHQYTISLHLQFHQFEMAQDITMSTDKCKSGFAQHKLDDSDMVMKEMTTTSFYDLPFVEYDGIIPLSVESNELDQVEYKATSESEQLPKRRRITSKTEGLDRNNVGEHSGSEGSCMQISHQLAEISKDMHRADFALHEVDNKRSSREEGFGMEDKLKEKVLGRKQDKVVEESTRCSKCGSYLTEIDKDLLTAEGSFMRLETQLLALHSVESLSSDLHSSTSTYPICSSVHLSAFRVAGANTCVSQASSICGSHQQFSEFSMNVLRLAHSVLAVAWKKWCMDIKPNIKEQLIDEVLTCADLFLRTRQTIFHAKGMMWKAMAAQAQSTLDSRAFLEHQLYISAGSLLKDFFKERVQERCNTFKKITQPFMELLEQINEILKFCFEQIGSHFRDLSLCLLQLESRSKFDGAYGETSVSQAIQSAVPLWLLLYHDVAHAMILGQVKSPANM